MATNAVGRRGVSSPRIVLVFEVSPYPKAPHSSGSEGGRTPPFTSEDEVDLSSDLLASGISDVCVRWDSSMTVKTLRSFESDLRAIDGGCDWRRLMIAAGDVDRGEVEDVDETSLHSEVEFENKLLVGAHE